MIELKPFPPHLTLDDLYRCCSGKPEGTWFIKSASNGLRVFVIEPGVGLRSSPLAIYPSPKELFEKFSPDLQLSYDEQILQNTAKPIADPKALLNCFSDFSLNKNDADVILKQMKKTLLYLFDGVDELRERARNIKRPIYIRPQMMGPNLRKIGGKKRKATYNAAHAQISPCGKIDIIPKHPPLFLGFGASKSVRTSVELGANNLPNRITAFCSIRFKNKREHDNISREFKLIRRGFKKRKAENSAEVRLSMYSSRKLSKRKPNKAKLVLPYANLRDLSTCSFSSDELAQVLIKAARCVELHHTDHVMIRDIKPENLLGHRDPDGNIQVDTYDLGLATRHKDGNMKLIRGAVLYHSPEIFNQHTQTCESYNGFPADIFAFGLSLYQIRTTFLPAFHCALMDKYFPKAKLDALRSYLKMKQIQIDYHIGWNDFKAEDEFGNLIKDMIHPIPALRPNISVVVERLEQIYSNFGQVQKAAIRDGKLYPEGSETPFHDEVRENHLFAFDQDGTLYVKKVYPPFQNTTGILPKNEILGAGEINMDQGVIQAISNKSEPYSFSEDVFSNGLQLLVDQLPNSPDVQINRVIEGKYISDPRSLNEIIKDADRFKQFALDNSRDFTEKQIQDLLVNLSLGSWIVTYSHEHQDHQIHFSTPWNAIENLFFRDIHQTYDVFMNLIENQMIFELQNFFPFMKVTPAMWKAVKSHDVTPFPFSQSEDSLEQLMTKKPRDSWLVHQTLEGYQVVVVDHESRLFTYEGDFDTILKDLDPEKKISFDSASI